MSMTKKIKMILVERDMTIKDLSDKLGYEGSYLYNKLSRDRMSEEELKKIADALNCDYDGIFTLRDSGKQI
ncbi:MAG: helix-turn-helix domain-containing protein [Candidatus Woodwardiibium sp.]|jgi:DNA-binding helix-turn-helix protein|nr:helix-turn-helix transcriptional regulator [Clostridiales bacterium]